MSEIIGVDLSTKKVAFAIAGDGWWVDEVLLADKNEKFSNKNVKIAFDTGYSLAKQFPNAKFCIESSVVAVGGVRTTLVLAYVSGAFQAGLLAAGVDFDMIGPPQWKKAIIGKGNAKKEEIASWLETNMPQVHAACTSQDQMDAVAIALWAAQK